MRIFFAFLLSVSALAQGRVVNPYLFAAGTCSTPSVGSYLGNEGFQTLSTGFERSGWTTANSPNPAFDSTALSSGKPSGACNQAFDSQYLADGVFRTAVWDSGTTRSTIVYARLYFYLRTNNIDAGGEFVYLGGVLQSTTASVGNRQGIVKLKNSSGTLQITGVGGTESALAGTITVGSWNYVDLKVANSGVAGACGIKLNGGTEQTFTDNGWGHWAAFVIGTLGVSSSGFTGNDIIYDLVALDSTGYIGP